MSTNGNAVECYVYLGCHQCSLVWNNGCFCRHSKDAGGYLRSRYNKQTDCRSVLKATSTIAGGSIITYAAKIKLPAD